MRINQHTISLIWGLMSTKKYSVQVDGVLFHNRSVTASWVHPKDSLKNRDASC